MPLELLPNGWVSDAYEIGDAPYIFSDALCMPKEQYDVLTPLEIEQMKVDRYQEWLNTIENPPDPPPSPPPSPSGN